ncbi:EEIG1/EHBP1 N-terminal domain-containing protein [Cynara cardunculus var. scolymus]|uniref:EEIG1/EHBP1 N-terminal domain-containing protein n=1 Tax=Cynara cardunculus var. scolymus TaxID=59895 RepID=A0A118K184_CYNCS|nr:EEIG1/EHBP1 N-terminal domain-containing protein [Cynara cardunculus var. scolymus]
MLLGLKTKNRRSLYVQLDYLINLVEIKPWPPSQSLRSLRSALIQWVYGDKISGSTKAVAPSIVSGLSVGDGKIEFNESFRLCVTLSRDMSTKAGDIETFQRNCIEFNLYEPRRDKTVKGQLLATATIDFAEYGIVKESLMISVPMTCKRTFGNTAQPMLFLEMQTSERSNRMRSSSIDSLIREGSLDKNHSESVSALMNEEYAEEAETASITNDDNSSQSSMAAASSTIGSNGNLSPQRENGSEAISGRCGKVNDQEVLVQDKRVAESSFYEAHASLEGSSRILSSRDLYSEVENARTTLSNLRNSRFTMLPEKAESYSLKLSKSSITNNGTNGWLNGNSRNDPYVNLHEKVPERAIIGKNDIKSMESQLCGVDDEQSCIQLKNPDASQTGQGSQIMGDLGSDVFHADRLKNVKSISSSLDSGFRNGSDVLLDRLKNLKSVSSSLNSGFSNGSDVLLDRLKNLKPVGASLDSDFSKGSVRSDKVLEKFKKVGVPGQNGGQDVNKVQHLEQRIRFLEGELREAAAIEVSLYSVVAEHGSSVNKVHAPARRLSRLYLHACNENFQSRRATSARTIIHKTFEKEQASVSARQSSKTNAGISEKGKNEIISPFKWKKDSSLKEIRIGLPATSNEWEDPCMVTSILEKIESWIFSLIIESIWWQVFPQSHSFPVLRFLRSLRCLISSYIFQTLAPYMQTTAAKGILRRVVDSKSNKSCKTSPASYDHEQVNSSLELWKTAFVEVCERICPVRAAGHDCGCLPMFNAILRESADEVPTDPLSDPISDARVLPIPWITDLFGIEINDSLTDENEADYDENRESYGTSFNSFHLLNALSELMMLPKDMLLSNTIRKEDLLESGEDCIIGLPCAAPPIVYHPPSASLIGCILGDDGNGTRLSRSGSSILRKSNTSDDELDELDSPLTSIIDTSRTVTASSKPIWALKDGGSRNTVRYQLLREVWMNSE